MLIKINLAQKREKTKERKREMLTKLYALSKQKGQVRFKGSIIIAKKLLVKQLLHLFVWLF